MGKKKVIQWTYKKETWIILDKVITDSEFIYMTRYIDEWFEGKRKADIDKLCGYTDPHTSALTFYYAKGKKIVFRVTSWEREDPGPKKTPVLTYYLDYNWEPGVYEEDVRRAKEAFRRKVDKYGVKAFLNRY